MSDKHFTDGITSLNSLYGHHATNYVVNYAWMSLYYDQITFDYLILTIYGFFFQATRMPYRHIFILSKNIYL